MVTLRIAKLVGSVWAKEQIPTKWNQMLISLTYKKYERASHEIQKEISFAIITPKLLTDIDVVHFSDICDRSMFETQPGFISNIHFATGFRTKT